VKCIFLLEKAAGRIFDQFPSKRKNAELVSAAFPTIAFP